MNPLHGIGLKLISVIIFSVMSVLIKASADSVPAGQAMFFRSFFALPVIIIWLAWQKNLPHGIYTKNPLGHAWRSVMGGIAMGLGFAALPYLPLPEVVAIGFTSALLTVIFAALILGEIVRAFRLTTVFVGFVGVMIVIWPKLTVTEGSLNRHALIGIIFVLSGAVFAALAQVFLRKLVDSEKTPTIVFWFSMTATLLSLFTLPLGWVGLTLDQSICLVLAGLLGGIAQIFLTSSYRHAGASLIAPFDYAAMLCALFFGYVLFDEVPTLYTIIGSSLIIGAGLVIIWRENRLHKTAPKNLSVS